MLVALWWLKLVLAELIKKYNFKHIFICVPLLKIFNIFVDVKMFDFKLMIRSIE